MRRHEVRDERAIFAEGERVARGCAHRVCVFGPVYKCVACVRGRRDRDARSAVECAAAGGRAARCRGRTRGDCVGDRGEIRDQCAIGAEREGVTRRGADRRAAYRPVHE